MYLIEPYKITVTWSRFFGKEHQRYVGDLFIRCDTIHIYIVTRTKLKYVFTWSPLRDHLKTKEMKIKNTCNDNMNFGFT